jgi:CDP-glucose 4,6-dehydratase
MEMPLGQRLRELPGPLLLTGHTGFKGTWMTFLLEHLNVPVVGYSLRPEKDSLFDRAERTGVIPEVFADIRDYAALEKFIDLHRPSTIIHMAAQPLVLKSYESPRETFDVNVMGTVNILDIAFKKDFVKAIIVVTTDKVYRNDNSGRAFVETDPLEGKDPYSASKVGAESVVAAWQQIEKVSGGPKVVSVRAGNVIGGGDWAKDRLLPDIVKSIFFSESIQIRNPESTRPWQHVLDPLVGYLFVLEYTLAGNINLDRINFGPPGPSLRVIDVLVMAQEFNLRNIGHIQLSHDKNFHEANTLSLDSSLSRTTLKFSPKFSQREAIFMTFNWWKRLIDGESIQSACNKDINEVIRGLDEK